MVSVELWASFWRTNTKNRSINLATTTTIWMELKGGRANRLSLPSKWEVQGEYYIYQNNLNIILHVIQQQNTHKIISTNTYKTTKISRYRAGNCQYLSPLHENAFIESGRENWSTGHVHLCTKWIQNGFGGVVGELLEN